MRSILLIEKNMKNKKREIPFTKDLKSFAVYVRKNHLKDFVEEQLRLIKMMDIPMSGNFAKYAELQTIEMSMISSEKFLISIEDDTAFDVVEKRLTRWKKDELHGISRCEIESSDIVIVNSLQKKAICHFLPDYTSDVRKSITIANELEDYYTKVEKEGLNACFEINKCLSEDLKATKKDVQYTRSLIEASQDPLFTINPQGKITDINEATIKITGVTRQKLIGSDFFNYFTKPEKAHKCYEQVFIKGFVTDYPLTIKDGKLTDVLFNGSVYKNDRGNMLGAVIVGRDLTEQKRVEDFLRKSLKEISDYKYALDASSIVAITDGKGIIDYANENFCKISKYKREELIGQNHQLISSGYHHKEFFRNLWITITRGKIWKGEIKNAAKDGSIYWVDTTIVPFMDERGKPYQYVAIRSDITKRKKFESELVEAKVFAELATDCAEKEKMKAESATQIAKNEVKAKQSFLANMSHEIRTPMNTIIGFTKIVLKTDLSEKQKEYLSAIKISGEALLVVINDILDLAKVNAGKISFEKAPFKMNDSLSAVLFLFETKAKEMGLKLERKYDNKIPEVVLGDGARLHQIMLNLLSNAIKFTPEGKITVSVRMLKEDKKKVDIEFTVADTGIGIAENKITKIFESFEQASGSTAKLFGGTGLGLAIVKELVERQGGSISVKSKINKGSIFSFILSFQKTTEEVESEQALVELNPKIKNIKVLVAEDNRLNQLLVRTILDDFGFLRDITPDGKSAIEKMKTKDYDIILMDLQMPEINGFEATKYIRTTLNSKIPIIALTADVTSANVKKCRAAGMNDYIPKPVDERVLYSKIVGLVKKSELKMI